jgi:two-component system chemotaxis response regulator CheB
MEYGAGTWILIRTTNRNYIEFIPLKSFLKGELRNSIKRISANLSEPVLSLRSVLIDVPELAFTEALPLEWRAKTACILRRGRCKISFNESKNTIEVSKERSEKFKTLIVDDSVTIRKLLRHVLESDGRFDVTHETGHPREALELIRQNDFDLVTMDLHLPDMTGADVIKSYMRTKPIRTVVISSLHPDESELVLQSLENGAIDYIQKPAQKNLAAVKEELLGRILAVAEARVGLASKGRIESANFSNQNGLLAIGASTGGTEAIKVLLSQMGDHIPPTLIVQHIPPVFSRAFAERLNRQFKFEVREAKDGDEVVSDQVLIAAGGFQMKLVEVNGVLRVRILDEPPVNRHRPSVDVLFDSIAQNYKGPVVGALLTGMGADGANGLVNLKKRGAFTIAQDDTTSVVFGMPKEAILRGGATEVCELFTMGRAIHRGFLQIS